MGYKYFGTGQVWTLFSFQVSEKDPNQDTYREDVNPSITMPFSTAAYRLHTYVGGSFLLVNKDYRKTGTVIT